jgi:hypothetical protein
MHDQPISPSRQRTLDAMAVRNLAEKTRYDYITYPISPSRFCSAIAFIARRNEHSAALARSG